MVGCFTNTLAMMKTWRMKVGHLQKYLQWPMQLGNHFIQGINTELPELFYLLINFFLQLSARDLHSGLRS